MKTSTKEITDLISESPFDYIEEIREELAKSGGDLVASRVVTIISKWLIFERGYCLHGINDMEAILKHKAKEKFVHISLSGKRVRVFDKGEEVLVFGSCNVLQPGKVHDLLVTTGV